MDYILFYSRYSSAKMSPAVAISVITIISLVSPTLIFLSCFSFVGSTGMTRFPSMPDLLYKNGANSVRQLGGARWSPLRDGRFAVVMQTLKHHHCLSLKFANPRGPLLASGTQRLPAKPVDKLLC